MSAGRQSGQGTAPPFITADDLADGPNHFVIGNSISVYQRDDGSTVLFIQIVRAGAPNTNDETFTWGLNCKGMDRGTLQNQIGRNMLDWPGKPIALVPHQSDSGRWFVNLHRTEAPF